MSYQYIVLNIHYSPPMANGPFHDEYEARKYAEAVFPSGGYWLLPIIHPTTTGYRNPQEQNQSGQERIASPDPNCSK